MATATLPLITNGQGGTDDEEELDQQRRLRDAMMVAGGDPDTLSALAPQPQSKSVALAPADYAAQPSAQRVTDLQSKLNQKPSWKDFAIQAATTLGPVIGSVVTGTGGTALMSAMQGANQQRIEEEQNRRQSLTQQIQAAQQAQEREYEADTNNRTRAQIAQTLAQSRQGVATTQAGARTGAAEIGAGAREYGADTSAGARRYTADQSLAGRKYAADEAMDRLQYGQDRTDARQARSISAGYGRQAAGFQHTDTKPTAAEDNRADLADNLQENLDQLEDIANRRPELFGKLRGRVTMAKMYIGTDDPDIAALKTVHDQLGMVSQGAHQMRSAYGVGRAADSIMNELRNGGAGLSGAIQAARNSAGTFTTYNRPTLRSQTDGQSVPRTAPATINGKQRTGTVQSPPSSPSSTPKVDFIWDAKQRKLVPAGGGR